MSGFVNQDMPDRLVIEREAPAGDTSRVLPFRVASNDPVPIGDDGPQAVEGDPGARLAVGQTLAFLACHVPLAFLLHQKPSFSAIHAILALMTGLWFAAGRHPQRAAYAAAYIVGAEVLWRMTGATIFWEFGKYAVSAIFIVALLRHRFLSFPVTPLVYFLALLPSARLTLAAEDAAVAKDQLSFNLSGPFSLMVAAWFFSHITMSRADLRRLFVSGLAPVIAIATLAILATATDPDLYFISESNFVTSGGFGPNQVSTTLGLGGLFALLLTIDASLQPTIRATMAGLALALLSQSALTFSRSGLYCAGGAAILAGVFLARDSTVRLKLVPVIAFVVVVGNFFIVPYLNGFTDGELTVRFSDTDLTLRDRIIQGDLRLWREHPMMGVGPGQAKYHRGVVVSIPGESRGGYRTVERQLAAHVEFSRMLAEHGLLGFLSLAAGLVAIVANVRRAGSPIAMAVVASMAGWSCLFMASNAMRIAAPSFAFGLGFATLLIDRAGAGSGRTLASQPSRRLVGRTGGRILLKGRTLG